MGICGSDILPPVSSVPTISGIVHMANVGDVSFFNSQFGGSKGRATQLEGFQLHLNGAPGDVGIEYSAHQQDVGDLPFVPAGVFCGSRGQGRRIEGITVRLTGPGAGRYTLKYLVHMANRGDSQVVGNNTYCGTRGEGRQIEGIHIWLENNHHNYQQGYQPPAVQIPHINTLVHMSGVGDVTTHGSVFAGSKGQARQLEGFQLTPTDPFVRLEYTCHAANVGDMAWVGSGQFQGSRGQGRRIEGIAVRIAGHHAQQLSVNYTVHMAGRGDSQVCRDGEYCGSKGEGRQIEGIHVWFTRR